MENPAGRSCVVAAELGRLEPAAGELTQLYSLHGASILSHCVRILGDRSSAEDATQDVFVRVGRCLGRLPAPDQVRPWLFRIATNRCLNELRSRNIRARYLTAHPALPGSDQENALAARTDARRFLERLSARARAVALLTYVDGMVQHEVATALGVSRRTVVNYLSRIRPAP